MRRRKKSRKTRFSPFSLSRKRGRKQLSARFQYFGHITEVWGSRPRRTKTRSPGKDERDARRSRSFSSRRRRSKNVPPLPRRIFSQQISPGNLELVEDGTEKSRRSLFPILSTLERLGNAVASLSFSLSIFLSKLILPLCSTILGETGRKLLEGELHAHNRKLNR